MPKSKCAHQARCYLASGTLRAAMVDQVQQGIEVGTIDEEDLVSAFARVRIAAVQPNGGDLRFQYGICEIGTSDGLGCDDASGLTHVRLPLLACLIACARWIQVGAAAVRILMSCSSSSFSMLTKPLRIDSVTI